MPPKAPSKEIECEGMPEGWICLEKQYISGPRSGVTYIRFQNDKHKNVLSLKAVIQLNAVDKGLDPEEELAKYERKKQLDKEEAEKAREARGILKGQKKEEAINAFRSKYGKLDGATVSLFPGWRGESKVLENCGQVSATYYDPEGRVFKLINDVEAFLGTKILNGEEIPDIDKARASIVYDENGKVVNQARRENCEDVETQTKKRRLQQQEVGKDLYLDSPSLAVVPVSGEAAAARADADSLRKKAAEIHGLLLGRGFPKETVLLAVIGKETDGQAVAAVLGIYYQLPGDFNARPCYQRVLQPTDSVAALACLGQYIFWSDRRASWKIGALDDGKIGFAFCPEDQPLPTAVEKPWQILKPPAPPVP